MSAEDGTVEVIHLWSSPRSVSTSLMYAFAQVQLQLHITLLRYECQFRVSILILCALFYRFWIFRGDAVPMCVFTI